jgi:hypothetical protein
MLSIMLRPVLPSTDSLIFARLELYHREVSTNVSIQGRCSLGRPTSVINANDLELLEDTETNKVMITIVRYDYYMYGTSH